MIFQSASGDEKRGEFYGSEQLQMLPKLVNDILFESVSASPPIWASSLVLFPHKELHVWSLTLKDFCIVEQNMIPSTVVKNGTQTIRLGSNFPVQAHKASFSVSLLLISLSTNF